MLFSCEDATNITQKGELNDARLFTNVGNTQLFLNEVYDRFAAETELEVSSRLSDEVAMGSSLVSNDTQRFFMLSTNGPSATIWNSGYSLINYCNRLIRGAALFTPAAGADTAHYNSMLAQARVLRAYAHFNLMKHFSVDMSDNNGLGVLLSDRVIIVDEDLPRATNGQLYDFIEADLAFAEANLGTPFSGGTTPVNATNSYKYVNINFINAMRARMYLYRKDYVRANQFADLVINVRPLSTCAFTLPANFPLVTSIIPPTGANTGSASLDGTPTGSNSAMQLALFTVDRHGATATAAPEYRRMWVDLVQGEVLAALDRPNNKLPFSSRYNTNGAHIGGAPLYDMDHNLFNLFTLPLGGNAQDFRRWTFIDRSATISATPATATRQSEVIVIDKYPGKVGSQTANDIKLFRASEIYFIKAECLVRSNNLSGAATLIRQVRQARNYIVGATVPTPVYANATAAFADILLERRKELCYEGHRWTDLKRLGADAGVTGTDRNAVDATNSSATSPVNILLGDFRFTLPIPQAERNVNNVPQNPGY